ncbi:hypothetical protein FRX31_033091, partial [Thalictrum thalictroides]
VIKGFFLLLIIKVEGWFIKILRLEKSGNFIHTVDREDGGKTRSRAQISSPKNKHR